MEQGKQYETPCFTCIRLAEDDLIRTSPEGAISWNKEIWGESWDFTMGGSGQ